mgnify:CR=1 FL=1
MYLMRVGSYVELVVYRVPIGVYVTVCRQLHAVVRIAVCGDHCSPISDTTIMASAGAQCNHVNHVTTQLPYAIAAAVMSFVAYAIVGPMTYFLHVKWFVMLPIFVAMMVLFVFVVKIIKQRNPESYASANTRVADAD